MNRTKKLMGAVTTSLMLTGTLPVPGAVWSAFDQTAPQPDESWKTDPQVQKAADTIKLKGTCDESRTQEEIVKAFPEFDAAIVQKSLKLLVYKGDFKQSGDGSKTNPFSYSLTDCHGG